MKKTLYMLILLGAGVTGAHAQDMQAVIDWAREVPMGPLVGGTVESVAVSAGDRVDKGAELMRLDATPYQLRLDMQLSRLELASAEHASAKAEYERQKELYDTGSLSTVELEGTELIFLRKKIQYQEAKTEAELARHQLSLTRLQAPFRAWVVDTRFVPGQNVSVEQGIPTAVVLLPVDAFIAVPGNPAPTSLGDVTVEVNGVRYPGKPELRYLPGSTPSEPVMIVRFTAADRIIYPGTTATIAKE